MRRYSGYFVKGYRFHTKNHENSLKSQNSGVVVTVLDSSNTQKVLSYYGSLKEGCKPDKFGITLVNFSHLTHSGSDIHDDPFVFASQVDKVFYAKDPQLEGWLVVRHVEVKDAFTMGCNSDQNNLYLIPDTCDVPSLHRNEVDGDDEIDVTKNKKLKTSDLVCKIVIILTYKSFINKLNRICKRIRIVSTKEVVQPAESTNQGQNISSDASDEASDPYVDKSILQGAKKRVRGPTKKKEIWNLASDEKVLVTFNELCQPIRDEGGCLNTLEFITRNGGRFLKRKRMIYGASSRVETGQFRTLVESWFTEEKQVESERKKINSLKLIEPHVTGTKSFARTKNNKGVSPSRGGMYCITRTRKDGSIVNAVAAQFVADIKAIDDYSSIDQEKTNNSDWTNDDLSKVKESERIGSAQVKYLQQGFMMFAAAVQEQVPNLNLSPVMNFMNMEADGLSSIHDNTIDKNPSSATGTSHHQNSHFSVHDNHPNKLDASHHHTSVSTRDKSGVHDFPINILDVNHHHTSGNKSAVCDTLNKSGTSYT
uniref:Transposase, Ptta/En/Spm, plant n=1 Tax=Tanacetum cinerariifolium TaxID=118510 RepID=A0A6L2LD01_TANCI|nr:transposase, Ptta/En/Spm, plant [Tanacetum cinerariifolium]